MSECTVYLSPEGHADDLRRELLGTVRSHGRLLLQSGPAQRVVWAQDVWPNAELHAIRSIQHAAGILRERGRNWYAWADQLYRRTQLIQSKLPKTRPLPPVRSMNPTSADFGVWALLSPLELLLCVRPDRRRPFGEVQFLEDRLSPPSRAYLKLWEALTFFATPPSPGSLVVDLGSSPGGWTWVLEQIGCQVVSVDKAPLHQSLQDKPLIRALQQDAFALDPQAIGGVLPV